MDIVAAKRRAISKYMNHSGKERKVFAVSLSPDIFKYPLLRSPLAVPP